MNPLSDQSESVAHPRIDRLWRDVGDDSPWYDKALWHAIGALRDGDPPARALDAIERTLAKRASDEEQPTIRERIGGPGRELLGYDDGKPIYHDAEPAFDEDRDG